MMGSWWIMALAAGLIINICDVGVTIAFAAKPWNAVLQGQGLEPSPFTPPYYVSANFIGGFLLACLYALIAQVQGAGSHSALLASFAIWLTTRLYGGGHVVMRQMPLRLFAIMSAGLGLGYALAGQMIAVVAA
jgi:hypothetical protein